VPLTSKTPDIIVKADGTTMVPVVGGSLPELVNKALYNIEHFDFIEFESWMQKGASEATVKLARRVPPARLYRIRGVVNPQHPQMPVLCVVDGYATPSVMVKILGLAEGSDIYGVPPDALEDVTDAAKRKELLLSPG
jgi:hypothetical protein